MDFLKSLFHARARSSQTEAHIAQDIVAKESGLGGVGRHGIGRKPRRAAVRLRGKQTQGSSLCHGLHLAHAAVEAGGIGEPALGTRRAIQYVPIRQKDVVATGIEEVGKGDVPSQCVAAAQFPALRFQQRRVLPRLGEESETRQNVHGCISLPIGLARKAAGELPGIRADGLYAPFVLDEQRAKLFRLLGR